VNGRVTGTRFVRFSAKQVVRLSSNVAIVEKVRQNFNQFLRFIVKDLFRNYAAEVLSIGTFSGYMLSTDAIDTALVNLAASVTKPSLPVFEVEEQLSVLSGRIPSSLFDGITSILEDFKSGCKMQAGTTKASAMIQPFACTILLRLHSGICR